MFSTDVLAEVADPFNVAGPRSNPDDGIIANSQRGKGDVKRANGPDPYSYVPIDQAARNKRGVQQRVSLTNKKKGSKA